MGTLLCWLVWVPEKGPSNIWFTSAKIAIDFNEKNNPSSHWGQTSSHSGQKLNHCHQAGGRTRPDTEYRIYFRVFYHLSQFSDYSHSTFISGIWKVMPLSPVTSMCPACLQPSAGWRLCDTSQKPAEDSIWGFWLLPVVQIHGGTDFCSSFPLHMPRQQKICFLGLSRTRVT